MSKLQSLIKQKLEEKNLSIKELERIAGLKGNAVYNILKGSSKNPKKETLEAIARIFECSVKDLMLSKYEDDDSIVSNAQAKPVNQESNSAWDPSLYTDIIDVLKETLNKNSLKPSAKKIHTLIWEIYHYTLSDSDKKVDSRFVDWIVNKYLH